MSPNKTAKMGQWKLGVHLNRFVSGSPRRKRMGITVLTSIQRARAPPRPPPSGSRETMDLHFRGVYMLLNTVVNMVFPGPQLVSRSFFVCSLVLGTYAKSDKKTIFSSGKEGGRGRGALLNRKSCVNLANLQYMIVNHLVR
jgi:hypothetical protein